ncbi:DUF222 domain-containing protein [Gordonia sp. TBRC 11910]|uniref:DUF222 domain-containing protein n=1 Tax=Gordonia asplenii TaxID=2725283 RepID=A0A848KXV8_9ACTN|nr:HNH endonuclease signature motif containing protein [Gordonia asplenii]NMO00288.1 DUF222 domain-containing protein [Gordonia asplenii]
MEHFDPDTVLAQFDVDESTDLDAICYTLAVLVRLSNAIDHRLATVTALGERLGIPRRKGVKSMVKLLIEQGLAPHIAYRTLRDGQQFADVPTVEAHARDGALSGEHVDAIFKGLRHIQARVALSEEDYETCVSTLTSQAFTANPRAVTDKARAIAISLAPEESEPRVAEDRALNELSFSPGADGRFTGEFDLDCVTAARLHTALDPLCAPVSGPDGEPDPRSAAKRRADAFDQIIASYLRHCDRPAQGGEKPNVLLMLPWNAVHHTGGGDFGEVAHLTWAGPVTAATAAALACDCDVSRVVVDAESVPLDVGREHRVVPASLRKAVIARDMVCIRCGHPASWCDVHHNVPWESGGETSLSNSSLLCRDDHTWLHQRGWTVVIGPDGHPCMKPPADAESQALIPAFNRRQTRPLSRLEAA